MNFLPETQFDSFIGFELHKLNYLLISQSYDNSVNITSLEISQLRVSGKALHVEFIIKSCSRAALIKI